MTGIKKSGGFKRAEMIILGSSTNETLKEEYTLTREIVDVLPTVEMLNTNHQEIKFLEDR